jgi:hypothetical protein
MSLKPVFLLKSRFNCYFTIPSGFEGIAMIEEREKRKEGEIGFKAKKMVSSQRRGG